MTLQTQSATPAGNRESFLRKEKDKLTRFPSTQTSILKAYECEMLILASNLCLHRGVAVTTQGEGE